MIEKKNLHSFGRRRFLGIGVGALAMTELVASQGAKAALA